MIAGVRQFKLINALGAEYDMTRPDALLHAPDGLGWGTEATVNRLGMTYIGINEKEIHQSPSGEMVFRTYEEYGRFLSFCQQGGLVLCYKPLDTWYYCECLISIQKSEIQWENNHLICPVQFTLLSYWYERVVAQTAEPPEPVEPNYRTVTGDPAVFNARYSYPIKDLSVAIQGSQELNGYDKPWVGGAGKNKLPNPSVAEERIAYGITYTAYSDGTFHIKGTSTRGGTQIFQLSKTVDIVSGMYWHMGNEKAMPSVACNLLTASASILDRTCSPANRVIDLSNYVGNTVARFAIYVANGQTVDSDIKPMLVMSSTATAYEPYENICPITAYTSVTITQSGSTTNTYEVELTGAGQVYKGTLDVTTGELTVYCISRIITSFNGVFGATPSGYCAFVNDDQAIRKTVPTDMVPNMVSNIMTYTSKDRYNPTREIYTYGGDDGGERTVTFILPSTITSLEEANAWLNSLATPLICTFYRPLTYQLTPTQLSNLIGQNTIKADAGEVTVTYRTDARTEFKVYPYQYSYKYGDTAQNVFDIDCDLPSYFKLTIFGERTNPSWRVVQNGNIVKSGKLNATIGSSQKLVINTDPKQTEIALYTLSNTRINNLYGYSDFATERIFALPQGECQVQVLTEDEQPPKVMIEVLKHV